tara:strand:+ start:54 stop:482 length:429 start_codon:yes stop_codon:yes gene_type:complete
MPGSEFKGTMKFGKLYDDKGSYHGELLQSGQPLYRTIDQDRKTGVYNQPGIYGFVSPEGDTTYYEGTTTSKSMNMLKRKGSMAFLGLATSNFDPTHMERRGFSKVDLPEGMGIDKYYSDYFSKGRKIGDGSERPGLFDFLKR